MASSPSNLSSSIRRQRIVDAATRLFTASRYEFVQIDDVARAAGVAKPTLYRYFATKEDLFLEGFDTLLGELADDLTAIAETRSEAPRALSEMIRILLDRLGGHNAGVRVLDGNEKRFGKHVRSRLCARNKQIRGSFAAVLRRGIQQKEFCDLDPDLLAAAIIGALRAVATKIPSRRRAVIARVIGNILMDGIASHAVRKTLAHPSQSVAQIDTLGAG